MDCHGELLYHIYLAKNTNTNEGAFWKFSTYGEEKHTWYMIFTNLYCEITLNIFFKIECSVSDDLINSKRLINNVYI